MDFQTVSSNALNNPRSRTYSNWLGGIVGTMGGEEGDLLKNDLENSYPGDLESPELEERGLSIDERARQVCKEMVTV